MKCLTAVWQEARASVIDDCSRINGLLQLNVDGTVIYEGGTTEEDIENAELDSVLVDLVATHRRMSISNILHYDDL